MGKCWRQANVLSYWVFLAFLRARYGRQFFVLCDFRTFSCSHFMGCLTWNWQKSIVLCTGWVVSGCFFEVFLWAFSGNSILQRTIANYDRMQERQNAIIILRCFHTEKSCTFRQYFISFIAAIKGEKIDFKLVMLVRTVRNEEEKLGDVFFRIILIKLVWQSLENSPLKSFIVHYIRS